MKKILFCISFVFIILSGKSQEIKFSANVSKKQLIVGERFQLQYSINSSASGFSGPDLSSFEVYSGPNQSSSIGMPQSDGIKSHTHDVKFGFCPTAGTSGGGNMYNSTAASYNNPVGLLTGRATGITETNTLNEVETRPVSYPVVYLIKNSSYFSPTDIALVSNGVKTSWNDFNMFIFVTH